MDKLYLSQSQLANKLLIWGLILKVKGQNPELDTGMLAEGFVFPISVLILPKTVCCWSTADLLWPQQDLTVSLQHTIDIRYSYTEQTVPQNRLRREIHICPTRTWDPRLIYKYSHHNIYTLENAFSTHCLWTDWASARTLAEETSEEPLWIITARLNHHWLSDYMHELMWR